MKRFKTKLKFLIGLLLIAHVLGCGKKAENISSSSVPTTCLQEGNRKVCSQFDQRVSVEFTDQAEVTTEFPDKSLLKAVKAISVCKLKNGATARVDRKLSDSVRLKLQDLLPNEIFLGDELGGQPDCITYFDYNADQPTNYSGAFDLQNLKLTPPPPLKVKFNGHPIESGIALQASDLHKLTVDLPDKQKIEWQMVCSEFKTDSQVDSVDIINGSLHEALSSSHLHDKSTEKNPLTSNTNQKCLYVAHDKEGRVAVSGSFYLVSNAPALEIRTSQIGSVPTSTDPAYINELYVVNRSHEPVTVQLPSLATAKLSATYHPMEDLSRKDSFTYVDVVTAPNLRFIGQNVKIETRGDHHYVTLKPSQVGRVYIAADILSTDLTKGLNWGIPEGQILCPPANKLLWNLEGFDPVIRVLNKPLEAEPSTQHRAHPLVYKINGFSYKRFCTDP